MKKEKKQECPKAQRKVIRLEETEEVGKQELK